MSAATTRERLLAAAREQIVTVGWQAASSRNITGSAGVPLGAVNYHFGSRDALLAEAAMGEIAAMFRTPWTLVTESRTPDDLLAALVGWTRAPDTTTQQQALLLEVMAHSRRDPAVAEALEASLSAYRDAIAEAVHRVVGASDADARALADVLAAQANGLWLQSVVEPRLDHGETSRRAVQMWRHLLTPDRAGT